MNIILFWSKPYIVGQSFEDWINQTSDLLPLHTLALDSHQRVGNTVKLYSYHNIENIPDHVDLCDASDYFGSELAYDAMQKGHSIAHISDLVRLKAATDCDGVVIDMDAVMINPFPNYDCFTSSLPAKKSGGMVVKFGKTQPRFNVSDWDGEALSIFPIKVHTSIKSDIENLINDILIFLSKPATKKWNFIMYACRDIANKHDHMKVMKPIHCGPVPAWASKGKCYSLESPTQLDGKTSKFGHILPSIDQIMKESYCVQHFFDSAFKGNLQDRSNFWEQVQEGSLLYEEAKLIYGEDWKSKKFGIVSLF